MDLCAGLLSFCTRLRHAPGTEGPGVIKVGPVACVPVVFDCCLCVACGDGAGRMTRCLQRRVPALK